uniref:(northern house mosquito) hypothetical protein n=1 Tax=Culex pipiens TaxID=7175 RepID=A0A8D8AX91_CULPI
MSNYNPSYSYNYYDPWAYSAPYGYSSIGQYVVPVDVPRLDPSWAEEMMNSIQSLKTLLLKESEKPKCSVDSRPSCANQETAVQKFMETAPAQLSSVPAVSSRCFEVIQMVSAETTEKGPDFEQPIRSLADQPTIPLQTSKQLQPSECGSICIPIGPVTCTPTKPPVVIESLTATSTIEDLRTRQTKNNAEEMDSCAKLITLDRKRSRRDNPTTSSNTTRTQLLYIDTDTIQAEQKSSLWLGLGGLRLFYDEVNINLVRVGLLWVIFCLFEDRSCFREICSLMPEAAGGDVTAMSSSLREPITTVSPRSWKPNLFASV